MEFTIEKYHLKSSSFFDYLTGVEKKEIKEKMSRIEFTKGDSLFKEHSFSRGVFILRKGKVKIFQTSEDGKQSIVYIYKKDDYFGYRPLLAQEPNPVSATAMDNVVVTFIPKDVFLDLLLRSASLAQNLLVVLSKEFTVWINKTTIFSQFQVKERVALSLLILNEIYRKTDDSNKNANIMISRDDFAGFVGTAKESLVRMLRIFKDEKVIVTKGTKIIILKPRVLLNMVENM
jgi:CRP/FNR family transcriptional regulator